MGLFDLLKDKAGELFQGTTDQLGEVVPAADGLADQATQAGEEATQAGQNAAEGAQSAATDAAVNKLTGQ